MEPTAAEGISVIGLEMKRSKLEGLELVIIK